MSRYSGGDRAFPPSTVQWVPAQTTDDAAPLTASPTKGIVPLSFRGVSSVAIELGRAVGKCYGPGSGQASQPGREGIMRVAIVGCGQIADAHVQQVRRIAGTEVVAVCDLDPHMAEQLAARFRIPAHYTDVDVMLAETRPNVVHVTTPPSSHLPIGRLVLAHGAHAYIEKPLTETVAQAEELEDLAKRAGRVFCVGHSYAFEAPFLRLAEGHAGGLLGDIVHIDAVMGYSLSGPFGAAMMGDPTHWVHSLPGGIAQNNISHPLSWLLPYLRDARPSVNARGFRWRTEVFGDARDRFYDEVRVLLSGQAVTAAVTFTCSARPAHLSATFYGTKAHARVSVNGRTLHLVHGGRLPGPFAKLEWAFRDTQEARRELLRHVGSLMCADLHFFEGLHELIRRFYSAIAGKSDMPISMPEAIRTTRIIEDIFESCAQSGASVP